MTGCVVVSCHNSSNKKVKMFSFPSDPQRKAIWIANIARKKWKPTKYSALCQYHFEADQFKKRPGKRGNKKLKPTAIPTIFGKHVIQILPWRKRHYKTANTECPRTSSSVNHCVQNDSSVPAREYQEPNLNEIFYEEEIPAQQTEEQNIVLSMPEVSEDIVHNNCIEDNSFQEETNTPVMVDVGTCTEEHFFLENEANTSTLETTYASNDNDTEVVELVTKRKKVKKPGKSRNIKIKRKRKKRGIPLKSRIKSLKQVGINQELIDGFHTFFTTDQIKYVPEQLKQMPRWCDKTLIQDYKLKFACGYLGYREYLFNQGYPLSSIRTLNETLDGWKFISGISNGFAIFTNKNKELYKSDKDRDYLILLDEISITSGIQYDVDVADYIDYVTLSDYNSKKFGYTHMA